MFTILSAIVKRGVAKVNNVKVSSEISPLKKVIIHTPGNELEQMTPETAIELLYDDILNKKMAKEQHRQLKGVLSSIAQPLEVKDLLADILKDSDIKKKLVSEMCQQLNACEVKNELMALDAVPLANQLITGTPLKINTLERFLSNRYFSLPPLPNFFFTRDSSMVINNRVFIGNMANKIRIAEALIMSHIFFFTIRTYFTCPLFA